MNRPPCCSLRRGWAAVSGAAALIACLSLCDSIEASRGKRNRGTLEDAAANSDLIVVGVVGDGASGAAIYEEGDLRTVYRQWKFRVLEVVMGEAPDSDRLTLLTRGGAVFDDITQRYAVDQYLGPQFEGGEQILACLKNMGDTAFRFAQLDRQNQAHLKTRPAVREFRFRTRRTDLLGPYAHIYPRSKRAHESVIVTMNDDELRQFLHAGLTCSDPGAPMESKPPSLVGTGPFIPLEQAIDPVQKAAKTYIVGRTGPEFFKRRYNHVSGGWKFPEERCRRPEAHCSPLLLRSRAVFRYKLAFPELGDANAVLNLTLDPNGEVIDVRGANPNCVESPSNCRIIVDSAEARTLAKDAGLEPGLRRWTVRFQWYERRCKAFVWAITNTVGETHGRTLMIDATSGEVCEESAWYRVS